MNVSPQIGPAIAASNQGASIASGNSSADDASNGSFASVMASQVGGSSTANTSNNTQNLSGNSLNGGQRTSGTSVSQFGTGTSSNSGVTQTTQPVTANTISSAGTDLGAKLPASNTDSAINTAVSLGTKDSAKQIDNAGVVTVPDKAVSGKQVSVPQEFTGTGRIIPQDRKDDVTAPVDTLQDIPDNSPGNLAKATIDAGSFSPDKSAIVLNQNAPDIKSAVPVPSGKSGSTEAQPTANGATDSDSQVTSEDLQAKPVKVSTKSSADKSDTTGTEDIDDDSDVSVKKESVSKSGSRQMAADPTGVTPAVIATTAPNQSKATADKADTKNSNNDTSAVSQKETAGKTALRHGAVAGAALHAVKKGAGKTAVAETTSEDADFAEETELAVANNAPAPLKQVAARAAQTRTGDHTTSQGTAATEANPATMQSAAVPAVMPVADKDAGSKLKGRTRETQSSVAAVDGADNTSNGDAFPIAVAPLANDAAVPSFHASALATGVTPGNTRESGMFVAAGNTTASHNIGSSTGASFTPAQNVRMEMGSNGGQQQVEVGFHDGTLGWLSVRATAATDGGLHLSMTGRGSETAAAVDRMLPSLQHFLQDHDVRAHSVSFAHQELSVAPVASMAMSTSAFSADSSNASQSDRGTASMGQQRSSNSGSGTREFSQQERNTQERAAPPRSSTRYEGLGQEQGLLSIRI